MNELQYLVSSKNGHKVFIDLVGSHVATHLVDDSNLENLTKELISSSDIEGEIVAFEKEMGRIIGKMDLVETNENDEILYAKRVNRNNFTRFVKNKESTPTKYLTVAMNKIDSGYELWSAWVGRLSPPFPGDENETPESKIFWSSHALVWDSQPIQEETITMIQPW